jgi:hypothetical protein
VLAFQVEQQRNEIGVRMALGAGAASVAGLVMRQSLVLGAIDIVAGAVLAAGVADFLGGMFYGRGHRSGVVPGIGGARFVTRLAVLAASPSARAMRPTGVHPHRSCGAPVPNTIYKTLSFRSAQPAVVAVPLESVAPMGDAEAIAMEERLPRVADPGVERPTNEAMLSYLARRKGKGASFIATRLDAIAIALLRRSDLSVNRRVLSQARRLEGTRVVVGDVGGSVIGDLVALMSNRLLDGVHRTSYLAALKAASELWLKEKPLAREQVSPDLKRLLGEASLLRRGEEGDAEAEYERLPAHDDLYFVRSEDKSGCFTAKMLDDLVAHGVPFERAIAMLLKGLDIAADILAEEANRSEVKESLREGKEKPGGLLKRPSPASYATRSSAALDRDFKSLITAAVERWRRLAPDSIEKLFELILAEGKDVTQLLKAIEAEKACLKKALKAKGRHPTQPWPPSSAKPCVISVGVGDLYIVDEEWLGNVAREISYIENARGGEARLRIHERETEEVTYEETERLTEESRSESHQTADRFELQSTVAEQTSMELGINASLNVSGTYGVTTVEASMGATFGMSRTESAASTVTKARETVSKAASEIRSSVRDKIMKTLRERTLDRNEHRFEAVVDNSSVFRFVEKKYRVQVRQYGTRLFLEFIVPEPGRTLLSRKAATHGLEEFTVMPDDITYDGTLSSAAPSAVGETHYEMLQARYDARGVEPPPRSISLDFGISIDISDTYGTGMQTLKPVAGYRVHDFRLATPVPTNGFVSVEANGRYLYTYTYGSGAWGSVSALDAIVADPGIVVAASMQTGYGYRPIFKGLVHGTLILKPVTDTIRKWQMDTWLKLRDGYLTQLAEAEAKLAEKMSGISPQEPPARLRDKERSEMQRSILYLLTGRSPNYSMVTDTGIDDDIYQFFRPAGCDRRSQTKMTFFDGAFEWHDMLSFYMPYPFAQQSTWSTRLELRTIDEKHRQFLSAGAARVMLPVSPGNEAKVLEFINTPLAAQEAFFARLEADGTDESFAGALPDISTNLLREILCERNDQYRIGAGSLMLNDDAFTVIPEPGFDQLTWVLDPKLDVGREVMIKGTQYIVATVVDSTSGTFTASTGRFGEEVDYYLGAVPIGDPWIEYVPTPLIILGGQEWKLGAVSTAETVVPLATEASGDSALESAVLAMRAAPRAAPELPRLAIDRRVALDRLRELEVRHREQLDKATATRSEIADELKARSVKREKAVDALIKEQEDVLARSRAPGTKPVK